MKRILYAVAGFEDREGHVKMNVGFLEEQRVAYSWQPARK